MWRMVQKIQYPYTSTRSFNFNWVNRFINCVFTQIRCLSVSLKYAMERCTCTWTNKYMWTWIQNRKVFGGWSDLHPVSPCRVMLVHIQKSTAITNTKVAQVLWPLYRDFHHKALYSVLQKQLQAALNALLQKNSNWCFTEKANIKIQHKRHRWSC